MREKERERERENSAYMFIYTPAKAEVTVSTKGAQTSLKGHEAVLLESSARRTVCNIINALRCTDVISIPTDGIRHGQRCCLRCAPSVPWPVPTVALGKIYGLKLESKSTAMQARW